MKHVKHIAWFFLAFVILLSIIQVQETLRLNTYSLKVVKVFFYPVDASKPVNQYASIYDPTLNCHLSWYKLIVKYRQPPLSPIDPIFEEVISCSLLHLRMIRKMFPFNLDLANLASQIYPEQTYPIHWVIEITDPLINIKSRPLVEKILTLNQKDGLAWRYLGVIYLKEGNIPSAIDAFINSCLNGDPGVNGCVNAGYLFEQQGEYEKAIYYYRLSRWYKSQEAADLLEAKLNEN